ncbi:MAG: hypothetical protein WC635_07645 [Bacteriovorax sp.]|jgi:hypothetical protein
MKRFAIAISFTVLFLHLSSCGADKLKTKQASSGLSNLSSGCACTSSYSPVCGDGRDYDNTCIAQCFGAQVINAGHCNCSSASTLVCGIDGNDHTECEARNSNIQIVKYIPCTATEL